MIVDSLKNASSYSGISDRLAEALGWLQDTRLESLAVGNTEIRGTQIFALVQEYETGPLASKQYEAHRKYIDIQYVAAGLERLLMKPVEGMSPAVKYDAKKDVVFFSSPDPRSLPARTDLTLPAGCFAVFFPQDAHIPGLQAGQPGPVRKIVIKVKA